MLLTSMSIDVLTCTCPKVCACALKIQVQDKSNGSVINWQSVHRSSKRAGFTNVMQMFFCCGNFLLYGRYHLETCFQKSWFNENLNFSLKKVPLDDICITTVLDWWCICTAISTSVLSCNCKWLFNFYLLMVSVLYRCESCDQCKLY